MKENLVNFHEGSVEVTLENHRKIIIVIDWILLIHLCQFDLNKLKYSKNNKTLKVSPRTFNESMKNYNMTKKNAPKVLDALLIISKT